MRERINCFDFCIAKRFAIYSSKEKAEKAMRELHDNYSYLWKIEHGLVSYFADETIAFRFPQEDEI